jgi:hypothetical protein
MDSVGGLMSEGGGALLREPPSCMVEKFAKHDDHAKRPRLSDQGPTGANALTYHDADDRRPGTRPVRRPIGPRSDGSRIARCRRMAG